MLFYSFKMLNFLLERVLLTKMSILLLVTKILSLVKFLTPASGLEGYWDPYPIDMEFRPPCMVLSTIGISKPGKLEGKSTRQCATHLHQLHVCMPSSRNKTRLLYRMSLDFAPVLKHIPFMQYLWRHFAEQVTKMFKWTYAFMFMFDIRSSFNFWCMTLIQRLIQLCQGMEIYLLILSIIIFPTRKAVLASCWQ